MHSFLVSGVLLSQVTSKDFRIGISYEFNSKSFWVDKPRRIIG